VAAPHHALNQLPLPARREAVRKALHLAVAVVPVVYSLGAGRTMLLWSLAAFGGVALVIEASRLSNSTFSVAFGRTFGSLSRPHEEHSITGATWLLLSCFVAVLVLSRQSAIAAMWCGTVGDPAATIVGRSWTMLRPPDGIGGTRKTIAGSAACAAASFAGVWPLAHCSPAAAAVIALAAAVAERLPVDLDDNIRVVAAAGIAARLIA
jgi:dolichol kinase